MLLKVANLFSGYGEREVIKDISMQIDRKEIVCILGANGAGKTTFIKTISGFIKAMSGNVIYEGKNILGLPPYEIVKTGISYVPQGNLIFPEFSVIENLKMGGFLEKDRNKLGRKFEDIYRMFPFLSDRKHQRAGTLSGGERQILGIGRALMIDTKLLMLDEPSFGLAPLMIDTIFESLRKLNSQGMTILLVEQNVVKTLELATRGYIIELGALKCEDNVQNMKENDEIKKAYLGF